MGIVYEAVDPVIGRTVAVKTIPVESSANPVLRQTADALDHAHENGIVHCEGDVEFLCSLFARPLT